MVIEEAFLTAVATGDPDVVESLAETHLELAARPEDAAWS